MWIEGTLAMSPMPSAVSFPSPSVRQPSLPYHPFPAAAMLCPPGAAWICTAPSGQQPSGKPCPTPILGLTPSGLARYHKGRCPDHFCRMTGISAFTHSGRALEMNVKQGPSRAWGNRDPGKAGLGCYSDEDSLHRFLSGLAHAHKLPQVKRLSSGSPRRPAVPECDVMGEGVPTSHDYFIAL